MTEYRNQHYVPVFYLKQWCSADERLCVFRRPHDFVVSGRYSPVQTGYERDLNDLYGVPKEGRKGIEKDVLSRVDGEASKALEILLDTDGSLLTAELRSAWVRFVVSMFYRHPQTISMIRREGEKTFRKELEEGQSEYEMKASPTDEATFTEFVENRNPGVFRDIGMAILPELITDRRIGEIFFNMDWNVLSVAKSKFDLLTSDRPLTTTFGFVDDRCVLSLPINPTKLFLATRDRNAIKTWRRMNSTFIASATNRQVVGQAAKYVYAVDDSQLRFVENRLRAVE